MMCLLELSVAGIDLVYNEIPLDEALIAAIVLIFIFITYKNRKVFPFNVIWGFLVLFFIYALANYTLEKIKKWLNSKD